MKKALSNPLGLFVVALLARLLIIHYGPMPANDDGVYEKAILNYFAGHGLAYEHGLPVQGTLWFSWLPPVYPVLVILYYKLFGVGFTLFPLRIAITVLGSLSCVWLYQLGKLIKGKELGLLAGYALALYPPQVLDSTSINPHAIANSLFILCLLLLLKGRKGGSPALLVVSGALLGIIALARGEFFSCFPWILLWLVLWGKTPASVDGETPLWTPSTRGVFLAVLFVAGTALTMSPWVIRNWKIHHRFILLSTNYGDNFYFTHNPDYHFTGDAIYYDFPHLQRLTQGLSEPDCAKVMFNEALRYIKENPGRFVRVVAGNFFEFWRPYLSPQKYSHAQILGYVVSYVPLFIFFLLGLLRVPWRKDPTWFLFLGLIAAKTFGQIFFYIIVRFREALVPIMILYAGTALLSLFQKSGPPQRD